MFLLDRAGNALELRAFADDSQVSRSAKVALRSASRPVHPAVASPLASHPREPTSTSGETPAASASAPRWSERSSPEPPAPGPARRSGRQPTSSAPGSPARARAAPPTHTTAPARQDPGSSVPRRSSTGYAGTWSASPRSPTDHPPTPRSTTCRDPTGNRRTGSSRPCSSASSPARDGRTTTGTSTSSVPRRSGNPEKEESDPQDESQHDPHERPGPPTRPEPTPDPPPLDDPRAPRTYANPPRIHPCSIRFNSPIQQGRRPGGTDHHAQVRARARAGTGARLRLCASVNAWRSAWSASTPVFCPTRRPRSAASSSPGTGRAGGSGSRSSWCRCVDLLAADLSRGRAP